MNFITEKLKYKKMKRRTTIFSIALSVIVILLSNSCQTLEEDTSGVLVANSFYQTEEDLESALVAVWAPLNREGIGTHQWLTAFAGADDLTTKPDANKAPIRETDRYLTTSDNQLHAQNWDIFYQSIFAANTLLDNLPNSDVDDNVKISIEAQAKFMRSWCYFHMVRFFGDLPLRTTADFEGEPIRTPVAQIYEQILQDLEFAEDNLPATMPEVARPTKWIAKALLSQVYITMAGWPIKDQSRYADARDKAKEVIDAGVYSLMDDYGEMFKIYNQTHSELVFGIFFCYECGETWGNRLGGKHMDPNADGGYGDFYSEFAFFNNFPSGPRKDATFLTESRTGIPYTEWSKVYGHPTFAKYRSGTVSGGDGDDTRFSSRTIQIIRYSHILTTYAEAQVMADGTPNALAYESVNMIRRRAAGLDYTVADASVDLAPGLSQTAFSDSVLQERAWEFGGEFTRWFDLIRREKVAEVVAAKDPLDLQPLRDISALPVESYYYLPIPQYEVDNGGLTQMYGY
jgi:hypothetical protein